MEQKNSKYIESYYCTKHSDSLYSILFNTTHRGMNFHAYSDEQFIFGLGDERDDETHEEWESRITEIQPFLPTDKRWLMTSIQCKDQITFYWMDMDLIVTDTKNILFSKNFMKL